MSVLNDVVWRSVDTQFCCFKVGPLWTIHIVFQMHPHEISWKVGCQHLHVQIGTRITNHNRLQKSITMHTFLFLLPRVHFSLQVDSGARWQRTTTGALSGSILNTLPVEILLSEGCQAKLAYKSSTGSMRNHLQWKHPNKSEGETTAAGIGTIEDHKSPMCNRLHIG